MPATPNKFAAHSRSQTSSSADEYDFIPLTDSMLAEVDRITTQSYATNTPLHLDKSSCIQTHPSPHAADPQSTIMGTAPLTPTRTTTITPPSSCQRIGSIQHSRSESRNAPFNNDKLASSTICPRHHILLNPLFATPKRFTSPKLATSTAHESGASFPHIALPEITTSNTHESSPSIPGGVATALTTNAKAKFYAVRARQLLLFTTRQVICF